jgi:hypothetical protein
MDMDMDVDVDVVCKQVLKVSMQGKYKKQV